MLLDSEAYTIYPDLYPQMCVLRGVQEINAPQAQWEVILIEEGCFSLHGEGSYYWSTSTRPSEEITLNCVDKVWFYTVQGPRTQFDYNPKLQWVRPNKRYQDLLDRIRNKQRLQQEIRVAAQARQRRPVFPSNMLDKVPGYCTTCGIPQGSRHLEHPKVLRHELDAPKAGHVTPSQASRAYYDALRSMTDEELWVMPIPMSALRQKELVRLVTDRIQSGGGALPIEDPEYFDML